MTWKYLTKSTFGFLIYLSCSSIQANEHGNFKIFQECLLGGNHTAKLIGKSIRKTNDEFKYYIQIDKKIIQAFTEKPLLNEAFQDDDLERYLFFKACKDNIMIFSVQWGNADANMAIRYNPSTQKVETMTSSSRGVPQYVYANSKEWFMVSPSEIPYKTPILYYAQYHGTDEGKNIKPLSRLPNTKGYRVTKFYSRSPNQPRHFESII